MESNTVLVLEGTWRALQLCLGSNMGSNSALVWEQHGEHRSFGFGGKKWIE